MAEYYGGGYGEAILPAGLDEYDVEFDGLRLTGVYQVSDIAESAVAYRTGDAENPGGDGVLMGEDHREAPVLTIPLGIDAGYGDDAQAIAVYRWLRRVWLGADRTTPGVVQPLRLRLPGRSAMRVFGRPRGLSGSIEDMALGRIPVTLQFQMTDPVFHSDAERVVVMQAVTGGGGGTSWPLIWPVTWTAGPSAEDTLLNVGDNSAPITVTFRGPTTGLAVNPSIRFVHSGRTLKLARTLGVGDEVTVHTTPNSAGAFLPGGGNVSGDLRGDFLSDLWLPPESSTLVDFEVGDASGTASVEIRNRDAYQSL